MKKGKIVLCTMIAIAAVGSGFAFKAKAFNRANVYYFPSGGSCTNLNLTTGVTATTAFTVTTDGYYVGTCSVSGTPISSTAGQVLYSTDIN